MSFNDAGPGSRVLYYSTSKSTTNKMHFVGHAEVKYIADNWEGPWEAQLTGYAELGTPVSVDDVTIHGWNRQHAITEIEWPTYESIVVAGDSDPEVEAGAETEDPGGDVVAKRVVRDFPQRPPRPPCTFPTTFRESTSRFSRRPHRPIRNPLTGRR